MCKERKGEKVREGMREREVGKGKVMRRDRKRARDRYAKGGRTRCTKRGKEKKGERERK